MVSPQQLERSSLFLKSLFEAKNPRQIQILLKSAAHSCLRVLLLLIKDCLNLRIPLPPPEKQKLDRHRAALRQLADKKGLRTRWATFNFVCKNNLKFV